MKLVVNSTRFLGLTVVFPVMLLRLTVPPGRPPWSAVAVAPDKPRGVVAFDEAGNGLTELLDGVI